MKNTVRAATNGLSFAVLAGLLACCLPVDAAEQDRFERLADNLVLGQSSIQSFAQDDAGFLWLGTQAGIKKFDGYRFESFRSDPDDPETLSHRFVTQLMGAESGQIWAATGDGLNRIDPATGEITRIGLRLPDGELTWPSISYGGVVEDAGGDIFATTVDRVMRWRSGRDVLLPIDVRGPDDPGPRPTLRLDRARRLWLAGNNGLWRFDRDADAFEPVLSSARTGINPRLAENSISIGPGNGVTYVNANGIFILDPDAAVPIRHLRPVQKGFPDNQVNAVAVDSGNNIWLRLSGEIVRIPGTRPDDWQRFDQPSFRGLSRNSNLARLQLVENHDGNIWLAGRFGLARYEPASQRLVNFRHDPSDPGSLPQTLGEIGYRIFLDDFGVLWVGANLGGLARLSPQGDRFTHVRDLKPSLISRNIVRAIAEQQTESGELVWASNQNAGVSVWRRHGARDYEIVHHYPPDFEKTPSIGMVRSIAFHPDDGSAWLAGSHALGRIDAAGAPIELVALESWKPAAVPTLRALHFLASDTLLAGGGRSVWLIDVATPTEPQVLRRFDMPLAMQVFDLLPRAGGTILVAGNGGLVELDLGSGATRVHFPAGGPGKTPRNYLFHLAQDADGRIWAGTRGAGLLRIEFDAANRPTFKFFGTDEGIPDDTIYAVLPDAAGSLWMSSNHGIIRFQPRSGQIRQYTPADGVQGWEFSNTVAHIGADGRHYFGGINGWNVFRPGNVRDLLRPPRVHLRAVSVNDSSVAVNQGRPNLDLAHDVNQVVVDYVGLHFADPERIRYAVRMRGLDDAWIDAGRSRRARYTRLAPGQYTFEVKAANLDGIWSSPKQLMQFTVAQPPWLTPWALALYFALSIVLVLAVFVVVKEKRRQLQILVHRRTRQLTRQKALVERRGRELEEALKARTLLFANVSHEFRTPLTLIRASIEKLEKGPDADAAALGRKYVNRLLRMVEQLLDLSRIRLARPAMSEAPWRLDSVVSQTVEAFRPGVEQQGKQIEDRINGTWHTQCPQNLVEKILLNLISNAVKFTPPDGSIKVSLQPAGENAVICVEDSGSGISESDQAMIFERFYRGRAADSGHVTGAGVGLALVADAARACGGSVDVTSRAGHGACFWITLPARRPEPGQTIRPARVDLDRQRLDLEALQSDREPLGELDPKTDPGVSADISGSERGTVLIVEDNADFRKYLAQSLAPRWQVEQAADGVRGFEEARATYPDLIITDLMMPNADGFEMLARLRNDIETSHIPVLFLTAHQNSATRVKAYRLSADAFLSKPFELEELKVRLEQMMDQRERVKAHLLEHIARPAEPRDEQRTAGPEDQDEPSDLAPRDQQLLRALDEWLKDNFSNSEIDIQAMADAVHLTPRTLQRKLKSLTGQTPAAYLRKYRFARARQLLQTTRESVTDIAHACGFSSSQYFSRVFRHEHGRPPEKWRRARNTTDV